jgi:hypothetical protein
MSTPKPKHLDCQPNFSIPLAKKYGVLLSIIAVMFTLGLGFNLGPSKNPELIPHADWCHHSRLYKRHNNIDDSDGPVSTTTTKRPRLRRSAEPNKTERAFNATAFFTFNTSASSELMYIPLMPRGVPIVTALVFFVWPLLPLMLHNKNSLNEAKLESMMAHALGQSSNFAVAEILRTQILFPEDLFLDKCNISPEDCLFLSKNKVSLPLFLDAHSKDPHKPSFCNGQFSHNNNTLYDDNTIIYNSLHHYPDVVVLLFGASLVSYFTSFCHWRILNPSKKNNHRQTSSVTRRSVLVLSDIAMLGATIVYLYFLCLTHDYFQFIGVFLGVLLQLMINRIISYEHTTPLNSPIIKRKLANVETPNVDLQLLPLSNPLPESVP